MATIKKQGRGYKITVSRGYDINGKQLREHMTWIPDPGMTARQIEKELNRQAVLFEEKVNASGVHSGNIRLSDFTEIFFRDHAEQNLKQKTLFGYRKNMAIANKALGHIKLKELRPAHIAAFYSNMREKGMRVREIATPKFDFAAWLDENGTSMAEMARRTGLSIKTVTQVKYKKTIAKKSAVTLAEAMGMVPNEAFTFVKDMQPLSTTTLRIIHRTLSAVLGRAVKWGYIQNNPAALVDLPSRDNTRAAFLDEDDARRLLELLADEPIKWRTIITFDLLSGLRRGELAGLRWPDIDIEHQVIYIRQTYNYTPEAGHYVDTPKTANSDRTLRVSQSAILLLLEYQKWQDNQRALLGDAWEDKDNRVFTTDVGAPINPDSITKWFTAFIKRSGLPKVTVHSLRHTYASLMIFNGVPLIAVSRQLGHAQSSTTANIYAHVIASAEARAAQTFDRFDDVILTDKHQTSTKPIKTG